MWADPGTLTFAPWVLDLNALCSNCKISLNPFANGKKPCRKKIFARKKTSLLHITLTHCYLIPMSYSHRYRSCETFTSCKCFISYLQAFLVNMESGKMFTFCGYLFACLQGTPVNMSLVKHSHLVDTSLYIHKTLLQTWIWWNIHIL